MALRASLLTLSVLGALTLGAGVAAADPPFRVARLSVAEGSVSYLPGDSDEWRPAEINYPMTAGDTLWSDRGSRAEMNIGSTAIRLGAETSAGFLNLDDRTVQIRLTQGTLQVHLRRLDNDQVFEVDTPTGAISLLRPGDYRIDAYSESSGTVVAVRNGEAEVTGGGTSFPIQRQETARIYGDPNQLQYDLVATAPPDGFDQWCYDRDRFADEAAEQVRPYVSREMIGYEDLASNGTWDDTPDYGVVWTPRSVPVGWAPYRYGHWAYIAPWGWTWVDDASWGFAPFHYGRWATVRGVWVWIPGPVVSRPVYAPALVAFVGGPNFNLSISFGGGGGVAWFPLGPREIYRPAYRVSETYVRNVNVTNVRNINVTNITNVTNVTNIRYANREAGITAVSHQVFTDARPVGRSHLRLSGDQLQQGEVIGTAPAGVSPRRTVGNPGGRTVAQPSRALVDRQVVVRQAPPSQNDSFRPMVRPTQTLVRQAPPVVNMPRRNEGQGQGRRFGEDPGMNRQDRVRPDRPAYTQPVAPQQQPQQQPAPVERQRIYERPAPMQPPFERQRPQQQDRQQVNAPPQQPQQTAQPPAMERVRPQRDVQQQPPPQVNRPQPQPREDRPHRVDRPAPERMQERREERREQRQEQKQERQEQKRENKQ